MARDIDHLIDRRALRKKLSVWRIVSLVALVVALLSALSAAGVFSSLTKRGPHIARISVEGMIVENRKLISLIDKVRKNDMVKGVVLTIDSPGGTTVGGEAIYEAVRKLARKKPTAASVGTLATSAGYMIATASDHIVARRSSIVGSIGVIFQYPQAGEMLDKIGFQMKEVKTSPLKAEPSPFHKSTPEAEQMIRNLIMDSYHWFVDLVAERRPLNRSEVMRLADGRIYTGGQGLDLKLIDALGGEEVAKDWLVKEKGLDKELEILLWQAPQDKDIFPFGAIVNRWLTGGKNILPEDIKIDDLPAVFPKRLFLDGLLSIWHK